MAAKKPVRSAAPDEPQRFVDSYIPYLLARTSRLISEEFHQALIERQIPILHWRVLVALVDGPMHVTDLAKIALEKQPTMSKIIDRMEMLELVRRQPGVADRRSTLVTITAEGTRVVKPMLKLAKQHEQEVLGPLGEEHARVLIEVLQKLIALHGR
ncbi:MAG: MarR family winged helix-turn-helix transcriptional regulator [Pseudomonadota bacterium]